jgi:hypothetical protein
MNPRLHRRYRRLLRAFPPSVRAGRGEEILSTLADRSPPGAKLPEPREAAALVVEGLRARARLAAEDGPGRVWAEGLQLGVLLLTLKNLTMLLDQAVWYWEWTALLAVAAVLVLRAFPLAAPCR